jgi:hypothetical protein
MFRELTPHSVRVPNGFAVTAEGYWHLLRGGGLTEILRDILAGLDTSNLAALAQRGRQAREAILAEARWRGVALLARPTPETIELLRKDLADTNAILYLTC